MSKNEQVVLVKYIKGGKDVAIYNRVTGDCRVERTLNEKTIVTRTFTTKKDS